MAKSSKSATLPPNLRVVVPPGDESDGFFSKLKKKFKFKKGRYNVDVNTGECENVAVVSFKKRSSGELLDAESPLKYNVGRSSERITRSESPKQARPASRTQSDRYMPTYFGHKSKTEVTTQSPLKISSLEKKGSDRGSVDSLEKKKDKTKSKSETSTSNEYSAIKYDKTDPHATKPFSLEKESTISNDFLATDDNTIDLDNVDIDKANADTTKDTSKAIATLPLDLSPLEPGYETLPEVLQKASLIQTPLSPDEPGYESVRDVRKNIGNNNVHLSQLSEANSVDFDPNYESVDDVKKKMNEKFAGNAKASNQPLLCSESLDSLDDPRYQSVKDAKMKPPKTYDITKSIESLDEPGYECLNDVKKRISTMDFDRKVADANKDMEETAVSKELTDSSKSKDSGFESKSETSINAEDNLYSKVNKTRGDSPALEDLYSTVKKTSATTAEVSKTSEVSKSNQKAGTASDSPVVAAGLAQAEAVIGAIATGLVQADTDDLTATTEAGVEVTAVKDKSTDGRSKADGAANTSEKDRGGDGKTELAPTGVDNPDEIDSDTELILDPGYAECADAIKGYNPYSLYSDGSGSKISSCASLDISAEDFTVEPGYAECADAIKTGAIKKISVSHEKLVVTERPSAEGTRVEVEGASEIYAVPQVLFRKKSKMMEERSSGEFSVTSLNSDLDIVGSSESVHSQSSAKSAKDVETKKMDEVFTAAPPLPARNYSLYLENEEAEDILPSSFVEDHIVENDREDDSAFEAAVVSTNTVKAESRDRTESSGFVVDELDEASEGKMSSSPVNDHYSNSKRHRKIQDVQNDNISVVVVDENHGGQMVTVSDDEIQASRFNQRTDNEALSKCSKICTGNVQNFVRRGARCVTADGVCNESDAGYLHNEGLSVGRDDLIKAVSNSCGNAVDSESLEQGCITSKSEEAGLSVVVEGKDGCKKTLRILEKEPSQKSQKKRKSRIENGEISTQCSEGCMNYLQTCDEKCDTSNSDTKDASLQSDVLKCSKLSDFSESSKTDTKELCPEIDKNKCSETTGIKAYHAYHEEGMQSGTCSKSADRNPVNTSVNAEAKSPGYSGNRESVGMSRFQQKAPLGNAHLFDPPNLNLTSISAEEEELLKRSVKMKSISVDSDSDDSPSLEQLPILAINESDLEDAFEDNCMNTADAVNANAPDCTDVENTAERKNGLRHSRTSHVVSSSMPKCDVSQDSGLFLSEHNTEEKHSEPSANKTDLVVDSQLYQTDSPHELDSVVPTPKSNSNDLSNLNETCRKMPSSADSENSDTSAGEVCDADEKGHDSGCECCMEKSANAEENHSLNTELKALPKDLNPNLYMDTEPTHMSLAEVMGAISPTTSGFKLSSSIDDSMFASAQDFDLDGWPRGRPVSSESKNIPSSAGDNDDEFRPPPRPPVAASRMESSSTSHSSQSNDCSELSPSAIAPPPFMIVSTSSQSDGGDDDDVPPAIPPRAKRVQKTTRPASSTQDFMESMRQLKDCGWYWGPLSWEEAELKLANKPEGTFLVRDSSDERYILSLSFKNMGRVHHTRIEHHKGHFSFWSQPDSHGKSTIKEFIEQCVTNSQNGRFLYFIRPSGPGSPPMPIHLLYPVSRFVQMRSLQHMCRFTILQIVRRDHLDNLPVPTRIKQYLKEAQYYVEYLDD